MTKRKGPLEGAKAEEMYNPLDKRHLGESVAVAMLDRPPQSLPPEPFLGAGVYAIYYTGDFPAYNGLSKINREQGLRWPLYVGKAIPSGGRKGGEINAPQGSELWLRLREHAQSIEQASNLDIADFACRYLVVDDIWIPLGETLMIQRFSPVWNKVLDGFGNHDPGKGRTGQKKSPWDILHSGRPWANRLPDHPKSVDVILAEVSEHIAHVLKSAPSTER